MKTFLKVIVTVAVIGLIVWLGIQMVKLTPSNNEQSFMIATVFPEPHQIDAFSLIDTNGKPFTQKDLNQQWTLLFFGFTNCPATCPTAMTALAKVYKALEASKDAPLPRVLFVSVDPKRDSKKRISRYVKGFNPHFLGATGNKEQLDNLTKQLSVLYMKVEPQNAGEAYSIDHSGSILLIDPAGKLHAVFAMPHDADKIVKDYRMITNQYAKSQV